MNEPARRVYSTRRLRIVIALLTLIFLPIVIGCSLLIYQYLRFSVLVEQRLSGEKGRLPARVYARPLVLRPGMVLSADELVQVLNRLRYAEREVPADAGQFAIGKAGVTLFPRPVLYGELEPITVSFATDKDKITRVKEIRNRSKKPVDEQALEPELVTYLYGEDREKRRRVRYEELPEHVVKAVLAIEDRRFFSHPGLDPLALAARAVRNLRSDGAIPYGGSTITQQLCKNFFLRTTDERGYKSAERSYRRKAQEALLAFVLERRASKPEILEMYLNEVYLGQSGSFAINGIGEAARSYFGKDVTNLTLPEAALLAGMIQSPNPYNPFRHEQRATERRNEVVRAMRDAGFIDDEAMNEALEAPLLVERPKLDSADAPYFVDLVGQQLAERYAERDLNTGNLSIYTSLDLHLQALAQQALERGLDRVQELIKKRTKQRVQGSLIAIEPASGRLVALVGGRSYGRSQYNRAMQARRQPGSTFKPFVYLTAFEATFDDPSLPPITPATVVEDAPAVFFYEDKEYIPTNYEDSYYGMVTLRTALARSLNVATVKVAEMVGYDRVAELWTRLGVGNEVKPYPAIALGSFEATPFEMASAYNVIANGGLKVEPVTILRVADERGAVIERHQSPPPPRVLHEESTYLLTDMLKSVVREGTAASAAALGFTAEAAGKTGTTNDYRDAWFVGFTPELLCVVWVGFDDNTPVGLSGARAALPIWVDFMKAALAGRTPTEFPPPPEGIVFVEVDLDTGLLARPFCPRTRAEPFVAGTEPRVPCFAH